MIAKRDEAKKLREESIAAKASGGVDRSYDDDSLLDEYDRALKGLVWPPTTFSSSTSTPGTSSNRGPIPSLSSVCAALLANHFDQLGSRELGYLQLEEREKVATQLARLRKCDAVAALKLAVEGSQCLILPECSEVDEDTMIKAMEQAAGVAAVRQLEPEEAEESVVGSKAAASGGGKKEKSGDSSSTAKGAAKNKKKAVAAEVVPVPEPEAASLALRVMKLKNCGRGMVDRTAAACINLTGGCLEVLQLTGCYRLNDLALTGLLSANRDCLLSLDLSCNSRISAQALRCIRTLTNLQELTLDNCTHLGDEALLHLLADTPSPSQTVASSSSSSSAEPDVVLPSLQSLSLVGLIEVTDEGITPIIRSVGSQLQRLSLSGCVHLTDLTIHSIRQHCGRLRSLGLGQLGEVTTAAMVGLFVAHPAVLSALTGQFSHHPVASSAGAPSGAARSSSSSSATSATSFHSAHSGGSSSSGAGSGAGSGSSHNDFGGADGPPSIGRLEEVTLQGTVSVTDDVVITLCESNRHTLRVLDLSGCHQLTSRTGMALRMHARRSLETLDLSFVRGVSQEALGSLVDACAAEGPALQRLTLWGCTQLGDKFFQGHRKHDLEVVGRMTA